MMGLIQILIMTILMGMGFTVSANSKALTGEQLFGDMRARHIGPALMSGRIVDLENHPTNSRIIYAGAAGGGVWRSTNGGATFNPIFDEYAQSIGAIELDPNDPDKTIWVGTGEVWTRNSVSVGDGLYRTRDGGLTWKKMGFDKSERISSVIVNPKDSKQIYVGVLGALWGDSEERGVYKSSDGGETWRKLLYVDKDTGCSDLILDPQNPNVVYAAMWQFRRTAWSFESGGKKSALYKSEDAGKTWRKIHNGFPSGKLGRIAITVAESEPNRLYAVLETEKDSEKGLYRSDDAGQSWRHMNSDFNLVARPFYFSRLTVDPKNPDIVVKSSVFGAISRDGGKTFSNLGSMHPDIHDVTFDPSDSDRMYVATDGGVYRSWDAGTTLEIVENIPVSQFYHLSVDNAEPYNIYGGLQDNGSWWGPSSSPGGVEARDWNVVGVGDGFRVLKHRSKPIIYSEMQGAENVWRLDTEKRQQKTIQPLPEQGDPELRFNWNTPIALSPSNDDRLYIGSQFLHVSDDMGDTWHKISPDLTTNDPSKQNQASSGGLSLDNSGAENHSTIFTIAESPLNKKVIWVGTDDGNVQITKNAGRSWKNVVSNIDGLPANTWVHHIEASVHDEATAYAVFDGHTANDGATYVYKTNDFGQSWVALAKDNIKGFARSIQEDYVNSDLLFLGTEFGLYISLDAGANWYRFTNNMPAVAVHYLEMHKKTNDLVMATHGRGVIILDDVSPLRELSEKVLAKKVHFFKPQQAMMREQNAFSGGSMETQFVGSNPPQVAKISYYMNKRHIFGKMKMEIFDASGQQVAQLTPGKAKGINTVYWDFRMPLPKVAKGKTFSFAGFTSPRVKAGQYKVVLTKGKKQYETMLDVIYDPRTPLSLADREQLYDTSMELYTMTESLAYLVYQIDEQLAFNAKLSDSVSESYSKVLEDLKQSLVVTTGDNYVGAAKKQLREKVAELYQKIVTGFQLPSDAEIKNLAVLKAQFKKANKQFASINRKHQSKIADVAKSKGVEQVALLSFEEFKKQ